MHEITCENCQGIGEAVMFSDEQGASFDDETGVCLVCGGEGYYFDQEATLDCHHMTIKRNMELENPPVVNAGYVIIKTGKIAVIGKRNNNDYVAWSYTKRENDVIDYYWGRYCGDFDSALKCFNQKERGEYSGE